MSDIDLSTALADLANQVELVDLMEHTEHVMGQRRRRRTGLTIVGTVAAVVAVVGGAIALSAHNGHSAPPTHPTTPPPTPTPTGPPLTLKQRLPRYIAPGAHLVQKGPGGVGAITAAAYHAEWAVNRSQIRFSIIDDRKLKPCPSLHDSSPHRTYERTVHMKTPCGPDANWIYPFTPLAPMYNQRINERTAHVAASADGLGIQDIEWREGPFHYVLQSNRTYPDGHALSGVPFADLVQMARSVPEDRSIPALPALPNPPGLSVPKSKLQGFTFVNRNVTDFNGSTLDYQRAGAHFTIYLEPSDATVQDNGPVNALRDLYPALHPHGVTIRHISIDGRPAVVWRGPQGLRGMRVRRPGFILGFVGRGGATIADFKRINPTLRIFVHDP